MKRGNIWERPPGLGPGKKRRQEHHSAGEVGAQVTGWVGGGPQNHPWDQGSLAGVSPGGCTGMGTSSFPLPQKFSWFCFPPVFFLQHLCRHSCPGRALGAPSLCSLPVPPPQPRLPSERPGTTIHCHACPGQPSPDCWGDREGKPYLYHWLPPSPPFASSWALCLQQPANASHAAMGLTAMLRVGTGEALPED